MVWYFAYGSNLNKEQLKVRVVTWKKDAKAVLDGWKLIFAKGWSGHRSGYANIVTSEDSIVNGAIYELTEEQMKKLDIPEGAPNVYHRENVTVISNGKKIVAVAYVMRKIIEESKPSAAYLQTIIDGLNDWKYEDKVINEVKTAAQGKRDDNEEQTISTEPMRCPLCNQGNARFTIDEDGMASCPFCRKSFDPIQEAIK